MRILMIEDDVQLCEAVKYCLSEIGYTVDLCHEGDDGLRWLKEGVYDLVLLDRMLPRLDGLSLLQKARKSGIVTPVIMMTALGSLKEVVEGLDSGADDYVVKPFAMQELIARVGAALRRPNVWEISSEYTLETLSLDSLAKTLKSKEKTVSLSPRETVLIEMFLKHSGQVLTRGRLLSAVWGPDAAIEEGNLENYVHFLRRRLKTINSDYKITTIRGVGYKLERIGL